MLFLALACTATPADTTATWAEVPWDRGLPRLHADLRGHVLQRAILHLHSPWSHDACDGEGWVDGVLDLACEDDLRAGLCTAGVDVAFLTDHPAHAVEAEFPDWLLPAEGDAWIEQDGEPIGNRVACPDGTTVDVFPGIEDELMPVGLDRHAANDPEARDALYNRYDGETVAAFRAAGATVLVAHTEQRDVDTLAALQQAGLVGVEAFNLHAMVDPDLREDFLGLDGFAWLEATFPFLDPATELEPDLAFLAFFEPQEVSLATWDALTALAPTTGIAGTDAHQNVLPSLAADGERFDSYRRMMRWFSNWLLVEGDPAQPPAPESFQAAVEAGRVWIVFEAFGTPEGFDAVLRDDAGDHEVGSTTSTGTLEIGCPELADASPRSGDPPEIEVRILRDGLPWATGCGSHRIDEPGDYRVEVWITPHHLAGFLPGHEDLAGVARPWILANPFRVR